MERAKAGVDFCGCYKQGRFQECCFCGSKLRQVCEELAEKDKRLSDDPRNAAIETKIEST